MKNYNAMTVGEIVADNFSHADVFNKYKIDFCCNGYLPFSEACSKAGVDTSIIIAELEKEPPEAVAEMVDFKSWSTDLLVDYILKYHHRRAHREGPVIANLLDKVCATHGTNHPELYEVKALFTHSLIDLGHHLDKEEMVLFPYIYELYDAQANNTPLPSLHCGTIESPIAVMMAEHDVEGERYRQINELTNNYTVPKDACSSYRLLYEKFSKFEAALHHHIHLENNIVFPRAILMEEMGV